MLIVLALAALSAAQTRREPERPLRQPVRGVHGAVAAGSEYATEAGMRTYYKGGNAVDVGVATMFAGSVSELSHYGFGGEAPILIRTKDGKVHAIAGVGTMPKMATAEMFRTRALQPFEVTERDPGGLKGIVPGAGLMPALVPGMVDAALLALREFGTMNFEQIIAPAIDRIQPAGWNRPSGDFQIMLLTRPPTIEPPMPMSAVSHHAIGTGPG